MNKQRTYIIRGNGMPITLLCTEDDRALWDSEIKDVDILDLLREANALYTQNFKEFTVRQFPPKTKRTWYGRKLKTKQYRYEVYSHLCDFEVQVVQLTENFGQLASKDTVCAYLLGHIGGFNEGKQQEEKARAKYTAAINAVCNKEYQA